MAGSPQCDPQREEVYRWERKFRSLWYDHGMTFKEARELLRKMCARYDTEPPVLKSVKEAPWTAIAEGDERIVVNRDRAKPTAVLVAHEAAHIIQHGHGDPGPDHGPLWLGIYIDLLDHFNILPRCMTEPSLRKAKLKFRRRTL